MAIQSLREIFFIFWSETVQLGTVWNTGTITILEQETLIQEKKVAREGVTGVQVSFASRFVQVS